MGFNLDQLEAYKYDLEDLKAEGVDTRNHEGGKRKLRNTKEGAIQSFSSLVFLCLGLWLKISLVFF